MEEEGLTDLLRKKTKQLSPITATTKSYNDPIDATIVKSSFKNEQILQVGSGNNRKNLAQLNSNFEELTNYNINKTKSKSKHRKRHIPTRNSKLRRKIHHKKSR